MERGVEYIDWDVADGLEWRFLLKFLSVCVVVL